MSSYIIGGKEYALEKRNLLCKSWSHQSGLIVDLQAKEISLYYPKGKTFVLDVFHPMTGRHCPKVISKEKAMKFMDDNPGGIDRKNYIKFFGEPSEV